MSHVKLNFLNWRPDAEALGNDGLITAENALHSEEGYIQYKTPTTFATNTAIGTCPSIVIKSVGTNNQRIAAFLHNATAAGAGYTIDLSIGLFSSGYTTIGLYTTISSGTINAAHGGNHVMAFDVTEYADNIFITAQAECPVSTALSSTTAPIATINATGYVAI